MKRKKILVYISIIAAITIALTMLPLQYIFGNGPTENLSGGSHGWICGTDENYVKFDIQDGLQKYYLLDVDNYMPPGWEADSRFFAVELEKFNGTTNLFPLNNFSKSCGSPALWGPYRGCWQKDNWVQIHEFNPAAWADIVWIKFWYTGEYHSCEVEKPEPPVRTHDMTCYQVWINEDNNFEFVFWWEYKNNNWVKIYDMEGNMVYEIDMEYGKADFEADLPDGMYKVQTFHEAGKILQEFMIGKP